MLDITCSHPTDSELLFKIIRFLSIYYKSSHWFIKILIFFPALNQYGFTGEKWWEILIASYFSFIQQKRLYNLCFIVPTHVLLWML